MTPSPLRLQLGAVQRCVMCEGRGGEGVRGVWGDSLTSQAAVGGGAAMCDV